MEKDCIWELMVRSLNNEASYAEQQQLKAIFEAKPALFQLYNDIAIVWAAPSETDKEYLEATYILHEQRMQKMGIPFNTPAEEKDFMVSPIKKISAKKLWSIAAIFIVLLFTTLFYVLNNNGSDSKSNPKLLANYYKVATKKGNKSQIDLPDGTKVWLNADSRLNYKNDFGNHLREVYLEGEAYFDVVSNPEKPFIVHTHTANIKVLGTAFNVKCYNTDATLETSLIHGRVEITTPLDPTQKWVLHPNEKLILPNTIKNIKTEADKKNVVAKNIKLIDSDNDTSYAIIKKPLTYMPKDSIASEIAWVTNRMTFNDKKLLEVTETMSRWFDVDFEFKKEDSKKIMIQTTFSGETLQQVMEALAYSLNIKYKIQDKKVTIY